MTAINDTTTLREYAHAKAVAAVSLCKLKGDGGMPHTYVEDVDVFDQLAKMNHAQVRQTQRIPSMRLLEFEAGGIRWTCGVAQ